MSNKYSLDNRDFFVELDDNYWVQCYPEFDMALAKLTKWYEQSSFKFYAGGFNYTVKILPTDNYKEKDTWIFVQINDKTKVQRYIEGRYIKAPPKVNHEFKLNQKYIYKLPSRASLKPEDITSHIIQLKELIDDKKDEEDVKEDAKEEQEDDSGNETDELSDDDEFYFDDSDDSENNEDFELECCICMDDLDENDYKFKKCRSIGTGFHKECITEWWKKGNYKCPCCNTLIIKQIGNCPTGTMEVVHYDHKSLKFPVGTNVGTYEIHYSLPSGIQTKLDDNPGTAYTGTNRYSYLPDTKEGTKVLKRLINAWNQRMTFRIGDSVTTGAKNVIVWNGIHHKTTLHGGAYGYPDDTYLVRVAGECDDLGVEQVEDSESENESDDEK